MASKPSLIPLLLPEDELLCSICQMPLSDPVTTPCGHNFCMRCISKHWKMTYFPVNCPHCRRVLPRKPDLKTNTILSAIMDHVKKVWPESEDVSVPEKKLIICDVCEEGRELSAVKTCVTCMANFCSVHAIPHKNSQALAKHCLCTPISNIQDLLCKKHSKVLEVFCMNHGAAICWQCTAKHRKCNTRSVEAMRTDWKVAIKPVLTEAQDRENATNDRLEALNSMSEGITEAAESMICDVQHCFELLTNTITHAQNRAMSFIEAEKEGALQKIEQQKNRLDDHMHSISRIMDTIHECINNDSYFNFLLPLPLLPPEVSQLQDIQLDGQAVERMILDLKQLNCSLESNLSTMLQRREDIRENDLASGDFRFVSGQCKRRSNLLKYSSRVTFDPMSASASMLFSEDGLAVTVEPRGLLSWKDYQVNKQIGFNVLCSEEFTLGQHYWEIQPPDDEACNWAVGVMYKIKNDLYQCLGQDSSSWCVRWQNNREDKNNEQMDNLTEGIKNEEVILPMSLAKKGAVKLKRPKLESKNWKSEAFRQGQEGFLQDKSERERNHALLEERVKEDGKDLDIAEENKSTVTIIQKDKNISILSSTGFFSSHNQEMNLISQNPPGKIGVLLDYDRGCLSFYLVSDFKVKLCCRFQAKFSAPLHPAIWLRDPESTMIICK